MSRCKYCGMQIVWIRTEAGKSMPCDSDPTAYKLSETARGRIVTKDGKVLAARVGISLINADGVGYEPHWAHCRRMKKELESDGQNTIQAADGQNVSQPRGRGVYLQEELEDSPGDAGGYGEHQVELEL